MNLKILVEEIKNGKRINKKEAFELLKMPVQELGEAANELREHFCSNGFDLCTIINGKNGQCSENCKFCAQSAHYNTGLLSYPLLSEKEIVDDAKLRTDEGVIRYSIVTSGKKLSNFEVDQMCKTIRKINEEVDVSVCVSFGLLDYEQFMKLKEAGITRVHNNLETSKNFFENVCTTHTYDDKIQAIKAAKKAGLSVCSGGIMGLGESWEDRIDMALALREMDIKSVPVNILNPIEGTPFENNEILSEEEILKIVSLYRFILPEAAIRLAGGRGLLEDKGRKCFQSGANAAITGYMLTTAGITVQSDLEILDELGYKVEFCAD